MRLKILSLFVAAMCCPLVVHANSVFYDNACKDMSGGGTIDGDLGITGDLAFDCNTCPCLIYQEAETTDAAACGLTIQAGAAYPAASVNTSGANTVICGGPGADKVTVTDYSVGAGDTVEFDVDGSTTTLTEGVDFECVSAGSNNACATNLAAAATATTGFSAASTAAVVNLTPDPGVCDVAITIADGGVDGAFGTDTEGTNGNVVVSQDLEFMNGVSLLNAGTNKLVLQTAEGYNVQLYMTYDGVLNMSGYPTGASGFRAQNFYVDTYVMFGGNDGSLPTIRHLDSGSPEGVTTASPGSIVLARDGGAATTFYIKESGVATNTGWVAYGDGTIADTNPSEPYACSASTAGPRRWYVNDTDDGAAAEVCVCHGITDDSTYDWVRATDESTACSFF